MAKLVQIGDAAPCRSHTEWSTDLLELGPDPKRRRRRPLSNASKNAPFRCRMRELWPKQWRRVCWIRGWRDSWVGDELQLGEHHSVGISSVAMSSSNTSCCNHQNSHRHSHLVIVVPLFDEIVIQTSSNWTYDFYSLSRGPNHYKSRVPTMIVLCIKWVPLRTKYLPIKNTDKNATAIALNVTKYSRIIVKWERCGESVCRSNILPLSQIISHFNFLGESKHLKFDQIYII
jgi:hypothetical protein